MNDEYRKIRRDLFTRMRGSVRERDAGFLFPKVEDMVLKGLCPNPDHADAKLEEQGRLYVCPACRFSIEKSRREYLRVHDTSPYKGGQLDIQEPRPWPDALLKQTLLSLWEYEFLRQALLRRVSASDREMFLCIRANSVKDLLEDEQAERESLRKRLKYQLLKKDEAEIRMHLNKIAKQSEAEFQKNLDSFKEMLKKRKGEIQAYWGKQK